MVDINLIGDDKTGEEDRVDDFTQTSSMDTQELAFEERTETFDTTKTTGFARKRSYSSIISTLIILAVVVLLAGAVYFFLLDDDAPDQETMLTFDEPQEDFDSAPIEEDLNAGNLEEDPAFSEDFDNTGEPNLTSEPEPEPVQPKSEDVSEPQPRVAETTPSTSTVRRTISPTPMTVNTQDAIQAVTSMINSVPANLNTTLLSYTGNRVRYEFVANTPSEANSFTAQLSDFFGSDFSVLSDGRVANNGQSVQKVLVAGTISGVGAPSGNTVMMSPAEVRSWITSTCRNLSLNLKQLESQQPVFSGVYEKTPMQVRILGSQASLVSFLQKLGAENMNVELSKVLLLSRDVVSYRDDNLVLVMNLFIYEPS